MGTICILLGLIFLIAFIGGGFYLAGQISSMAIMGQNALNFMGFENPTAAYAVIVGVCAFIGLLICLNLVMHGLTYNKVIKQNAQLKKLFRSIGR